MKYKRPKPNNKYISNSSRAKRERRNTAVRKRSTALAIIIIVSFALTRIGVLDRPFALGGALPRGLKNISEARKSGFIGSLSEKIADFCFGYLRGEKDEPKAVVQARDKDEAPASDGEAEEIPPPIEPQLPRESRFMPTMPCMGELSSDFGARVHPVSGAESFHKGIDIAVSEGSEVYACEGGVVTVAQYNEYSGNFIKIEHRDGYVSSYSHLSKIVAETGDEVERGSLIGLAGSTGIATGPHLHFEILKSGEVQNPLDLIGR